METKKIVVVGSTNMDMVIKTNHIPVPGETVLSGSFFMNPGGKGANQAVSAARLGGEVTFVSKVGNDVFGKQSTQLFEVEGINTSYMLSDDELPSGVALITVDKDGENSIVVASGANANLLPGDLAEALDGISQETIVLMQLEIPLETVLFVAEYAASKGAMVILNPAPMNNLPADLLRCIDMLTPNETEAERLSGIKIRNMDSAKKAAGAIYQMGVKTVVITLGPQGALMCDNGNTTMISAPSVDAVDTTAAGDVFNGALTVALSDGKILEKAVQFACKAASISVTRMGAQPSIPYRSELIAGMEKNS